jgi:hypothetical protein
MNLKRLGPTTGLALTGLLVISACGEGGSVSSDTSTPAPTTATTAAATTTTMSAAAVKAEATKAFTTFFDGFKADPSLLEDGETLTGGITSMRANPVAATVTMNVDDVTPLDKAGCEAAGVPDPCATIKYDLVVGGNPVVPDQTGYVVYQNGKWKVSKTTFCTLAAMGSGTPAGC